jgi:hypothetical protein
MKTFSTSGMPSLFTKSESMRRTSSIAATKLVNLFGTDSSSPSLFRFWTM